MQRLTAYSEKLLEEKDLKWCPRKRKAVERYLREDTVYIDYNSIMPVCSEDTEETEELVLAEADCNVVVFDCEKYDFLADNSFYIEFKNRRKELFRAIQKETEDRALGERLFTKSENGDILAEEYFLSYLNLIIDTMKNMTEAVSEEEEISRKRFLGEIFLLDCFKANQEKAVFMTWLHPFLLLQYGRLYGYHRECGKIGDEPEKYENIEAGMLRRLASVVLNANMPKRIYGDSVIYTLDRTKCCLGEYGILAARQMRNMSTLSDIDSIRILEKVIHCCEKHHDKTEIRVAYFGEFSDLENDETLNIEKYLNLPMIKEKYNLPHVSFFHFTNTGNEQNGFYELKNEKGGYSLTDPNHMERLFKEFQMVLFLDQGYYYKKEGQEGKQSFADAYSFHSFVKNRMLTGEKNKRQLNRYSVYETMLSYWMRWQFAYFGDKSGNYQLSRLLYDNIRMCSPADSDIYTYISMGKKIEDINLEESNLCRGEFYYGNELIISHFSEENGIDISNAVISPAEISNGNESPRVFVSAWRIFKSLFDNCYKLFSEDWKRKKLLKQDVEDLQVVCFLQSVTVGWDYSDFLCGGREIKPVQIRLELTGMKEIEKFFPNKKIYNELSKCIVFLFEQAYGEKRNEITNFIREVINESVRSSCRCMRDYLFAYTLDKDMGVHPVLIHDLNIGGSDLAMNGKNMPQTRQMIHSLIKDIGNMRIREAERNGKYILRKLKQKYCRELEDTDFILLLNSIREHADKGVDEKDMLRYNISILTQKQGN